MNYYHLGPFIPLAINKYLLGILSNTVAKHYSRGQR